MPIVEKTLMDETVTSAHSPAVFADILCTPIGVCACMQIEVRRLIVGKLGVDKVEMLSRRAAVC